MDSDNSAALILLADDEQFITVAYKAGLEEAGYRVAIAADGAEALEKMRSLQPDLVLLDLIMPNVDGFEVLQTVQQDATLGAIPIIVLTNLSQPSDEQEVLARGAADFLVKADVSLKDVCEHIERVLADTK